MIYGPLSAHVLSTELPLAVGATLSADGQALVVSNANGVFGVAPSAGAAGEVFVGFVNAQTSAAPFLETTAVKIDEGVSSAGASFTTTFTPLAGTLIVQNPATGATIPAGGWVLTGNVLTVLGVGTPVRVTYQYALTVAQAVALMGNQVPSGYAGSLLGSVGVSQRGTIYTNQFDSSKNWSTATGIKLAANGKVTDQTGSGVLITGAYVKSFPSLDYPYLGIEFSAA